MEENIPQNPAQPVQSQPPMEIQPESPSPWLKIVLFSILGLVLVGGLVFAGIQIGKNSKINPPDSEQILPPTQNPVATLNPTLQLETTPLPDWNIYIDPKYNYQINYPNSWTIGGVNYQATGVYDSTPSYEGVTFQDLEGTVNVIV